MTIAASRKVAASEVTHRLIVRNLPRGASLGIWLSAGCGELGDQLFLDCSADLGPTQRLAVSDELLGQEIVVRCRKPGLLPFQCVTVLSGPQTEVHVYMQEDRIYEIPKGQA
jgi:hypothetical protein